MQKKSCIVRSAEKKSAPGTQTVRRNAKNVDRDLELLKKTAAKSEQNIRLAEVAKEAAEAGMTYGKYVQKKAVEEQMKENQKKLNEKKEKCIREACAEAGLADKVIWFSENMKTLTPAQKIMREIVNKTEFPAKASFMYCDELDMCFFFGPDGSARCSYSGTTKAGSNDIKHNIIAAFKTAEVVLNKMQELYATTRP